MPSANRTSENDGESRQWNRAWTRKIWEAQNDRTRVIAGKQYRRIPYGREGRVWTSTLPCHDCAVTHGQFHVPGCDVERCPACHGQMITCGCADP